MTASLVQLDHKAIFAGDVRNVGGRAAKVDGPLKVAAPNDVSARRDQALTEVR